MHRIRKSVTINVCVSLMSEVTTLIEMISMIHSTKVKGEGEEEEEGIVGGLNIEMVKILDISRWMYFHSFL
jgi:hypothetical protein